MQREIAAIEAGMDLLRTLMTAKEEGQKVLTVPDLYLRAQQLMEVPQYGTATPTELQIVQDIAAQRGLPVCPFCEHTEVEGENLRQEEDSIAQSMQCDRCEETWDNHYVLVWRYKL